MIATNGIQVGPFYIPPFTAHPGQIVLIHFPNHPDFLSATRQLANILINTTSSLTHEPGNTFRRVDTPLDMECDWRNRFYPTSVQRYIRRNGNPENDPAQRAVSLTGVTPWTAVNQIPNAYRKLIALCTTLSWTNKIIFDLAGLGPPGGIAAFQLVKESIGTSGIAIFTDNYDEFKGQCSQYIPVTFKDKTENASQAIMPG
jgi:hypothetical protein